jgi:hypothetical protein
VLLQRIGTALGFVSLGVSLVSFVVPVLPTVPLLILTCAIFSKSSPRWHAWLLAHRRLGPSLRLWEEQGAIEMKVRVMTTAVMSLCLFYPVFLGTASAAARIWLATCAAAVFAFLWTRPLPARKI